ncbi:MAG: acyl carrier protein [Blastocatellales bacterium]
MTIKTVTTDQIIRLLAERVHIETPSVDTDLMEAGLLDSLSLVELMTGLEEQFDVRISFDEIEIDNFSSVSRIVEFLNSRLAARTEGAPALAE